MKKPQFYKHLIPSKPICNNSPARTYDHAAHWHPNLNNSTLSSHSSSQPLSLTICTFQNFNFNFALGIVLAPDLIFHRKSIVLQYFSNIDNHVPAPKYTKMPHKQILDKLYLLFFRCFIKHLVSIHQWHSHSFPSNLIWHDQVWLIRNQ